MRITPEDCGEKVMSQYLAQKITGEIPPSVIEVISWGQLKRLMRLGILQVTTNKDKQKFFGLVKENYHITERLFSAIAGSEVDCSVINGIVYVQIDIGGRTTEFSIPWFVIHSLVLDDEYNV